MEQSRTDASLQFLNRGRDGRARYTKRVGGTSEARAFDDAAEDAEQVDTVQGDESSIERVF